MPKTELLRDVVDVLALLCRPCTCGSMKTKYGNVSWVGRFRTEFRLGKTFGKLGPNAQCQGSLKGKTS